MTFEEFNGPPSVMMATISKAFKAPINPVIVKKNVVGDKSGNVMYQKFCQGDTPSTSAASYISKEIFFNPARNNTISYPMPLHINTIMTAGNEWVTLSSQSIGGIPNGFINTRSNPNVGSNIHDQTMAIATLVVNVGEKIIAR